MIDEVIINRWKFTYDIQDWEMAGPLQYGTKTEIN